VNTWSVYTLRFRQLDPRRAFASLATLLLLSGTLASAGLAATAGPAAADTTFTFNGGGWGHGVGMSQYGAQGRALAGHTTEQILGAYYPGTQLSAIGNPEIRVHLATTASLITFEVTGSGTITVAGTPVSAPGSFTVQLDGGGFTVTTTSTVTLSSSDALVIPLNGSTPVRVSTTGHRYKDGELTVRRVDSSLQVVARVTMQDYLKGLAEMPSSWGIEALKSQAVAGRTYAYRRVLSPRTSTYNILSTTTDQVYSGFEKEAASMGSRWVDAVGATAGQILTYNGNPIEALYHSSNGGYGDDSGYVYVTDQPYLRGIVDLFDQPSNPSNPNYRWTRSYTGTELAQYLKAYGPTAGTDIGPIVAFSASGNFGRSGRIDRATVTLTGTKGSKSITGAQFRSMINGSAPSNRQFQSTLLFFAPIGSFDSLTFSPDGIRVAGWTAFLGSQQAGLAHVYVNGVFRASVEANAPRPDIAQVVPGVGPNTGFDLTLPVDRAVNNVCVYGLTPNGSANLLLGCRDITVPVNPLGSIDILGPVPGGIALAGWALDPNTTAPIPVHVYVNGQFRQHLDAGLPRSDIAAVFPAYGAAHGFAATLSIDRPVNTVCAYAINVGPGDHQLLGCRTVTNSIQPFGSIDIATGTADGQGIRIAGWAIDPDTVAPIDIHVYVDGAFSASLAAGQSRPDVASAFPGYGPAHGFSSVVPAALGRRNVCAYAINVGPGNHQLLGCRTVTLTPPNVAAPFGSLDVAAGSGAGIRVSGWTIDPDTTGPIPVHVYVDGAFAGSLDASLPRPDLVVAVPGYGPDHGFSGVVPAAPGTRNVCVFAINNNLVGPHALLACRTVTVVAPDAAPPFGSLDLVTKTQTGVQVRGWAIDPDTADPIAVHVYVNGVGYATEASVARPDVGAAYPLFGANHGFALDIAANVAAAQTVCVYAINNGPGTHTLLGCRTV
jgi:SpoIID/LytB domain protein